MSCSEKSKGKIHITAVTTVLYIILTGLLSTTFSAPYWGTEQQLKQPDGSKIQAKMYGDEFYGWYETIEGNTIVQDHKTGWYYYAELSGDSSALVPTGIKVVTGRFNSDALKVQGLKAAAVSSKHIKVKPEAIRKMHEDKKKEMSAGQSGIFNNKMSAGQPGTLASVPGVNTVLPQSKNQRVGHYIGLVLLVDFSDDPATIPPADIDNFCNQQSSYTQFGNNGSVRQYYSDISGGKLDYTNVVTNYYYRAAHPKTYYSDASISYGQRARELITEALTYLENNVGFDFSTLSFDSSSLAIYAINCLYAGNVQNSWSEGLWPHSSTLGTFSVDGVHSGSYQITNIGSNPSIRTFIHENGHMLMGWDDLYDYGYESVGAGNYDIMAYGGSDFNPVPTNPYFRYISGWETITDITYAPNNSVFSHTANSVSSFWYTNPSDAFMRELFAIESRNKIPGSRNYALPDEGLLIWHIDTRGSNDNQQMTCSQHYYVSVEQADNAFHLENNGIWDGSNDLFHAGGVSTFTDATFPSANWWCNTSDGNSLSYLNISNISGVGPVMSFSYCGATDIQVTHPSSIVWNSLAQPILVSTGYDGLLVNLYSAHFHTNLQQTTSGGGSTTFSVLADFAPDTLWVTVTGQGRRYQGAILVTGSGAPPMTPSNLTATAISSTQINLTWTDNSSTEKGFYIEHATSSSGPWSQIGSVGINSTTYSNTRLTLNTTHWYRVRAYNSFGNSDYSSIVSATTLSDQCAGVSGGGNGLQGTTIGLTPPWAPGSEYCKATDGDINTFYDCAHADSAYTGLDFGKGTVIGKIRYYPRSNFAQRMVGGTFQVSMYAENYGWVNLYTIATTPVMGWNEVTVSNPMPFGMPCRYVRYVAPDGSYGNIAEMEFYPAQFTITASAGANGSISPSGSVPVSYNASQTFTITPESGYVVDAVTVDGSSLGAITLYTFANVTVNHTISAIFKSSQTDPCAGVQGGGSGLKGTVFGLNPPWSAGSEYCKATDGDISTFYDYSQANGACTGLDLGSAKIIGKIRYYPRSNFASRMTGGKFQGSNTSNSSGFVDLYTITTTPVVQWNEVTISNGTAYRWVRYLAPDGGYGNIAEMEFSESVTDPCAGVLGGGNGLQGTTFGLNPPWSAGSEYCKATDGDINTFYDYSQANGACTGLDLGSAKIIGKIRYYPRSNFASRMTGGKFQGSNTSNSSGFVDLYTITTTPVAQWNEVTISNGTAYRWVRYLAPDGGFGNIAEVEFYSTQAITYEAENATLSGGAQMNTNHAGYSESGFVDGYWNSTTAQVSFTVNAGAAGNYVVKLRYSAGNGNSTNTGLYVNGVKIKNITCSATTNWDIWADEQETLMLNAGNNVITYKAETASGSCINLDNCTVSQ